MKVDNISGVSCKSIVVRSNTAKNRQQKFLYNKVMDVVKKEHVGAIFNNDKIIIEDSFNKDIIIKKLKEMGIDFFNK